MTRLAYTPLMNGLPDNVIGSIVPQNVRDIVESVSALRMICTRAAASVATTATYATFGGFILSGTPSVGLSLTGGNTFTTTIPALYGLTYKFNLDNVTSAQDFSLALFKGATQIPFSDSIITITNGKSAHISGSISADVITPGTEGITFRIKSDANSSATISGYVIFTSGPFVSP